MERWAGKIAVVTGASAGIGAAIAIDLTKSGLIVIGLAPFIEEFEPIKYLVASAKGQFHAYACDITNEQLVNTAFDWIEKTFGNVNILVNNAGVAVNSTILGENSIMKDLLNVIDVNIVGLLYCTRAAHKILHKTGEPGYIINISSIGGYSVPVIPPYSTNNVYPGTKHCVRAITEVLRQELIYLGKQVRVSMISPGVVKTGIFETAGFDSKAIFQMPYLQPEEVSAACLYMLGTPPHVQIHDIIIKPVGELL